MLPLSPVGRPGVFPQAMAADCRDPLIAGVDQRDTRTRLISIDFARKAVAPLPASAP